MPVSHDKPMFVRARTLVRICAGALFVAAMAMAVSAHAAVYDPLNVISYETWRASSSMSAADIQAFLDTQAGPLKSLITTDYVTPGGTSGHGMPWKPGEPKKSAAQIIFDAAQYWNINPRIILATLQKEESLLTLGDSANAKRLRKAMGCGVYDNNKDGVVENQFPGFGNQIFNGARVFSTYEITYHWVPGMTKTVTVSATGKSKTIVPVNACTFALYVYTPYYPQVSFWNYYVSYFGDPLSPPRLKPVYRFRSRSNGTYYYTASETKRYSLVTKSSKTWTSQGVSFTCDTSATANNMPLYQLYNTRTHKYLYTISSGTRDARVAMRPKQWRYDGIVCLVSTQAAGTAPVYKLEAKSNHQIVLTSSLAAKVKLTTGRSATFTYAGTTFYLAASTPTTTPVGPTP
jgi:hypothetical protein